MIEHWTLIFKMAGGTFQEVQSDWNLLLQSSNIPMKNRLRPYLRFTDYMMEDGETRFVVSANMRAWRDFAKACVEGFGMVPRYMWGMVRNYPLFFPEYQNYVPAIIVNDIFIPVYADELSEDERRIHQDVTMKFICDRGISHEIVRHRVGSYAQESTRYCNYGLDKFDRCITVVEPAFITKAYDENKAEIIHLWERTCANAEVAYFKLLDLGCTPQEARDVLPTELKTEVIVTMNLDAWEHFCELRCPATAHPNMRIVANMAHDHIVNNVCL